MKKQVPTIKTWEIYALSFIIIGIIGGIIRITTSSINYLIAFIFSVK